MVNQKHIAVITGDIVNSSKMSEEEKSNIQNWFDQLTGNAILLKPKFFRGDSFQLAVKPESALTLALKCRAELRSQNERNDARISIGIGEVTTWNEDVLLSNGPAFERSGKNLDELKGKGLRIIIVTGNEELDKELETYCFMADSLIKKMTSVQANVVYYKLEGMFRKQSEDVLNITGVTTTTTSLPQEQIGVVLGISQPAVSKALKAANWKAIQKFLERYKQIIEKNYGTSE